MGGLLNAVTQRLNAFGYEVAHEDEFALGFCIDKACATIKNECNLSEVPDGLFYIAVDMAVGEFLRAKRVSSPSEFAQLDVDGAVKTLRVGDVSAEMISSGETADQKLAAFIEYLLSYGKGEFACYRKLKW